jgi:hypothetical protein
MQAAIQAVRARRYRRQLGIAHGSERRPQHHGEQFVAA